MKSPSDTNPPRAREASGTLPVLAALSDLDPWPRFVDEAPISFARRHRLTGVLDPHGQPTIVMASAQKDCSAAWAALDAVRRLVGEPAVLAVAPDEQVLQHINRAYEARTGHADHAIQTLAASAETDRVQDMLAGGSDDLLDGDGRAPVIKLANALLFEAVKIGASDVHVQPLEDRVAVRMRIDGVLFEAYVLPQSVHEELVSRIKVMGEMDIAEKRLPQDGRATVRVGDRTVDLRISSVPTSFGERVVLRLLDKSARLYSLSELGMPPETLGRFGQVIRAEHGLVLVTGPTGSGKSTTLYGSLQQINATELNVLTLEDPIEYQLTGISQMQVSEKKGMTFARGLRSVLRQDPDIIMVGEIRDRETADLAIQAALTGHLVFSTLHTNDAASAVTRLLDLGVEPYLVASSLLGVMAQRLVRRVCPDCAQMLPDTPAARADLVSLQMDPNQRAALLEGKGRVGTGCASCRNTGYRGRVGLFELLSIDDTLREPIQQQVAAAVLKRQAMGMGMQTLREDGIRKILSGQTTAQEVLRVTFRGHANAAPPEATPGELEATVGEAV